MSKRPYDQASYTREPEVVGFKEQGQRVFVTRFQEFGVVTGKSDDLFKVKLDDGSTCWNKKKQIAATPLATS